MPDGHVWTNTYVLGCTDNTAWNFEPNAVLDYESFEPCASPGDLDGDLSAVVSDILGAFPEFGCTSNCSADMDGDGKVTGPNFLKILLLYCKTC